jgi:uncharacterized protein (DUF4415 family)
MAVRKTKAKKVRKPLTVPKAKRRVGSVKTAQGFTEAQKADIAQIVAQAMIEQQKASGDAIGERLARLKARPEKTMVNFRLEAEVLEALDRWAKAQGIGNRTDALRALILSAQ